ncbi:MAG: hypothetical protein U9N39_01190, partial [Campylobacterota bacterium]|nr:hypothetical protein [Campylobacterota bacterium]
MKKLIITSLSILAFATVFTGCGGSGSVSDMSDVSDIVDPATDVAVDISPEVDQESADVTTPSTPYN